MESKRIPLKGDVSDLSEFPMKNCWFDPWFRIALVLPLPFWGLFYALDIKPLAVWWMLVVVAPIVEELAFRGSLQTLLLHSPAGKLRYGAIGGANALTALAFGATHALVNKDPSGMLTFFPGLVFGVFRERHRGVASAILLHSYYNAGLLLI